jgi:hypothetical protein
MAGSRTLKLSILADTADLVKGLKQAEDTSSTFGDKLGGAFKAVGTAALAAGAAIGALAIKSAIDGVKAALDDEKAQRILAQTLENTTDATKNQIAAVESYITQTSLAVGVTDDKLRPAFSRLVRSTKDTEEAQKLLNLALDISSATGKPLEAIANSLGKAYDGNTNALGRLGLGIDQSILKTKDFDLVYNSLRTSFNGFSANEALTFQGRIDRLNVAFDEAKESIGFALLPVLGKFSKFLTDEGVPALNAFIAGLTGEKGISTATEYAGRRVDSFEPKLSKTQKSAFNAAEDLREMAASVGKLFSTIDAGTGGQGSSIDGFVKALQALNAVANVTITILRELVFLAQAAAEVLRNPLSTSKEDIDRIRKGLGLKVSSAGFDTSVPSAPSMPQVYNAGFSGGASINLTVNGAIDSESTARQIVSILNDSQARGTLGGAGILV